MIQVISLQDRMDRIEEIVQFFWDQWGTATNFKFYQDCMQHACMTESSLPRFYVAMLDGKFIGSYALLRSELNSRQDLEPWFGCLYISPEFRGQGLGELLQNHAFEQAQLAGYDHMYLCTDLEGYYEQNRWEYLGEGYMFNGEATRIYQKSKGM
ncbi:GNAT family N-acetyltransferase [Paenibacillus selenitireducens]|uniref:GNAT family N-acetyltransferase n=1 Tax=Paenibacillus selenitireducens TaxID=1324314 RepID=UPI0009964366|nr:GNAT family N-acetyltransferase [Paenibacillus selenitireducens]